MIYNDKWYGFWGEFFVFMCSWVCFRDVLKIFASCYLMQPVDKYIMIINYLNYINFVLNSILHMISKLI